jgi:Protein of unknown function (DUF3006).
MIVIIDRFEGDYAVVELEDMRFVNMNKELLPPEAKEGDVIEIIVNTKETKNREKKIGKLMDDLFKD